MVYLSVLVCVCVSDSWPIGLHDIKLTFTYL